MQRLKIKSVLYAVVAPREVLGVFTPNVFQNMVYIFLGKGGSYFLRVINLVQSTKTRQRALSHWLRPLPSHPAVAGITATALLSFSLELMLIK